MIGFLRGVLVGSVFVAVGLVAASQLAGPIGQPVGENLAGAPPPDASALPSEDAAPVPGGEAEPSPVAKADATSPDVTLPAVRPQVQTDAPSASGPVADTNPPQAPATESVGKPSVPGVASVPLGLEGDTPATASATPAEPPEQPPSTAPEGGQILAEAETAPANPSTTTTDLPDAPAPAAPTAPGPEMAPKPADLPPPLRLTAEDEALLQPPPEASASPEIQMPEAESDSVAKAAQDTETAKLPDAVALDENATFQPAPGLDDQATGVVTGRLPRIGDLAPPTPDAATQAEAALALADPTDQPPLQRYARNFAGAAGKPLFAILLEDTGSTDVNRQELAALDLPLSIVIDPLSAGAADRAAIWRAGGQEVIMASSGIPAGATASDLEQTFQALSEALPEAVAVIDPDGKTFQDNRPLATQVVPILAGQGRGLVTFDRGLNAADQVAQRENLGAAKIFRRIDGEGEDAPVIRRYLDRAAFKAAQDGRVAVIGNLRPETVAAILEWAIEGKSATVTLAPVSALLMRDGG